MDTAEEERGGTSWERSRDVRAPPCVTQIASGKCPGTRDLSLWCDDLLGWSGDGREAQEQRIRDVHSQLFHASSKTNNTVIILPLKHIKNCRAKTESI